MKTRIYFHCKSKLHINVSARIQTHLWSLLGRHAKASVHYTGLLSVQALPKILFLLNWIISYA